MKRAVALLLISTVVLVAPADGAGVTVHVSDDAFGPTAVTVALGTTVTWSFEGAHSHTTTSDQGFWDSPQMSSGTYPRRFTSAGTFAYHCRTHDFMHGRVVVRAQATGGTSTGWTIRWSTGPAPAGRAFDAQYRREGTTTWRSFRVDTKAATGFFNPARSARYFIRARTTNTATGQESGWSPALLKRIT